MAIGQAAFSTMARMSIWQMSALLEAMTKAPAVAVLQLLATDVANEFRGGLVRDEVRFRATGRDGCCHVRKTVTPQLWHTTWSLRLNSDIS